MSRWRPLQKTMFGLSIAMFTSLYFHRGEKNYFSHGRMHCHLPCPALCAGTPFRVSQITIENGCRHCVSCWGVREPLRRQRHTASGSLCLSLRDAWVCTEVGRLSSHKEPNKNFFKSLQLRESNKPFFILFFFFVPSLFPVISVYIPAHFRLLVLLGKFDLTSCTMRLY